MTTKPYKLRALTREQIAWAEEQTRDPDRGKSISWCAHRLGVPYSTLWHHVRGKRRLLDKADKGAV